MFCFSSERSGAPDNLSIHQIMGSITPNVDVGSILSKLTLEEKVRLLAAKDWWRTPAINRDNVFVPQIKVRSLS